MNEFQGFALFPRMRARWIVCAWWEDSAIPWEVTAHGERGQMPWWPSGTQAPQAWLWEHDMCAGRCRCLSGLGETSATEGGVSLSGCMQVKSTGIVEQYSVCYAPSVMYPFPFQLCQVLRELLLWPKFWALWHSAPICKFHSAMDKIVDRICPASVEWNRFGHYWGQGMIYMPGNIFDILNCFFSFPDNSDLQWFVYFRALRCFHECQEDELSELDEKTQDFHEKLQRMVTEGKCPDGPPGPKPPKPDFENMTCVQEDVDVCLDWVKHLPPKEGSPYPGICR